MLPRRGSFSSMKRTIVHFRIRKLQLLLPPHQSSSLRSADSFSTGGEKPFGRLPRRRPAFPWGKGDRRPSGRGWMRDRKKKLHLLYSEKERSLNQLRSFGCSAADPAARAHGRRKKYSFALALIRIWVYNGNGRIPQIIFVTEERTNGTCYKHRDVQKGI